MLFCYFINFEFFFNFQKTKEVKVTFPTHSINEVKSELDLVILFSIKLKKRLYKRRTKVFWGFCE